MSILNYVTSPFKKAVDFIKLVTAKKFIGSAIRTWSAAFGGALMGWGIDPGIASEAQTATEKVLSGLVTIAIVQLLSWLEKAKTQGEK